MPQKVRFGFDIEGRRFSLEYIKRRFEHLHKKVDLFEIPVYRFISGTTVNEELLKEFMELAASYDFKFTAHASDDLELTTGFKPDEYYVKRVRANLDVAERIGAEKIVFHHRTKQGNPINVESNVFLCIENTSEIDPFLTERVAKENRFGFVLDIPHLFLYYAFNKLNLKDCYNAVAELVPDHLHISNTYFEEESILTSLIYLLRGDINSVFVKLIGDFHLPLHTGHINYTRIFKKLRVPETVIMEISSRNYKLLMKGWLKMSKKSEDELEKRGYLEDVKYLKRLLRIRKR